MKFFDKNTYRGFFWWKEKLILALKHPTISAKVIPYYSQRFISDQQSRFGKYNYKYKIIFLAGMAMSGTTWMKNLVSRIPGYYTRSAPMPNDLHYVHGICDSVFSRIPKHGYTLYKTHLQPKDEYIDCVFRNGVDKLVITHRDLRDIVVSRYHRQIDYPKSKDAFDYVDYKALGFEKSLDHSIELVGDVYKEWILGWLENKNKYPDKILIVKFEDMKSNTIKVFKKVLDFYSINLEDEHIRQIVEECRGKKKENIAANKVLPFGISSNFRSGKIGSWKTELTAKQKQRCKELFGDTLIKTGYEEGLEWT